MNTSARSRWVVLCTLSVAAAARGQTNLTANGGFEAGNSSFDSDYAYAPGANCCEGEYTVGGDPHAFNPGFVNPPPASAGSQLMIIVNGSTAPNLRVWKQIIAVEPGRAYAVRLQACTAVLGGPAVLEWQVNGELLGSPVTLPDQTQVWVAVESVWTAPAGATVAEFSVRNLNTSTFPNDFYLDNLSIIPFEPPCAPDVGAGGGVPGQDGLLDNNDFIAFITHFFNNDPRADAGRSGGLAGPDGLYDNNDFIVFINQFFDGC